MTRSPLLISGSNWLIAMLSAETRARLMARMVCVTATLERPLLNGGRAQEAAYFPVGALAVLAHTDQQARTAGVAVAGPDAMVGVGLVLGSHPSIHDAKVVIEGEALCLPRDALLEELRRGTEFRDVLLRYAHALLTQISFNAFCERVHSIEQRLIRWLLLADERTGRRPSIEPGKSWQT